MMWNHRLSNENGFQVVPKSDIFHSAKIAVIGCGSVGGFAAWMLGGLGASELVLIDRDHLSESNLRRHVASASDTCNRKVNACANFIASRLVSPKNILPIHCDVLHCMPMMTEVFERVDAVVVAVDDERVRYAAAFLARARSTLTVMMGVYSGGWACESVLEGIDDSFPCYGCSSASLGRVGVAVERKRIPYLGRSIHSEAVRPFEADFTSDQSTVEPSAIHVSIAASHGINALNTALQFRRGASSARPDVAQRMRLPSMAEPPVELGLNVAPFRNETVFVHRRSSCLECGNSEINRTSL